MTKSNLSESSVSRVWQHISEHDSGTISAWRSASDCNAGEKFTRKQNQERDKKLRTLLQSRGYSITRLHGTYIEDFGTEVAKNVSEDAYFVVDIKDRGTLLEDLVELGEAFEQDSIVFIPQGGKDIKLIGTNHCENGYPGYGNSIDLGEFQGGEGEFFSRVGSRAFKFESVELQKEIPQPGNIGGRYACKKLAEVYAEELGLKSFTKKNK